MLDKLKARGFNAPMSTHDFPTLCTTLPSEEKALFTLHVSTEVNAFSTSEQQTKYHALFFQNICDALTFLLDNILYDLALICIDRLYGFLWALIVLPWFQIHSCFFTREPL